jgi:hypothetical protein
VKANQENGVDGTVSVNSGIMPELPAPSAPSLDPALASAQRPIAS